jgi:hypothetical protein
MSTLSQKTHTSDRNYGNDKQDFTASRNLPNRSDDDDDFPTIKELLSGIRQKSLPASADLNGDDHDGFTNIDELLSDMQQKGPTSVDPDYGGMADMVDNGTRGGSPIDSSRSTAGSSQDPIILCDSDDESVSAESETDYSNLEVNVRAKSHSDPPIDMADVDGSGAALISDRRATGHQDDDNNHNGIIDQTKLCLSADHSTAFSLESGSDTHRASKLLVNTKSTQRSMGSVDHDVTREMEDEGCDAFAEGNPEGDNGTSTKRANLPAPFDKNRALDNAVPELQDSHVENTQVSQLEPAATSPRQSDLKNGSLRKRLRRGPPRDTRHKPPHTAAPIRPAITDLNGPKSRIQIMIPGVERELGHIDQETDDDDSADESDDEDYSDMSNAAGSSGGGPRHPRKRLRRAKHTKHNDVEIPSTHALDVSYQATTATSSVSMQESEEVPIHGYLTLKTIESKVVYCLTFSQELLPEPGGTLQRQGIPRIVSSSRAKRDPERLPVQERAMSRPVRTRFSSEEDELLLQLKGEGLSWDEISDHFPERSNGSLQVRYSTKLKPRSEKPKNTRKRRRSG